MKRIFKTMGFVLMAIVALIVGVIGVLWVSGSFNPKNIEMDSIDFTVAVDGDNIESTTIGSTQVLLVKDSFQTSMNFAPENATNKIIKLKVEVGQDVVSVPSQVLAGSNFTIEIKKDENGNNIGGEVKISAYDINNQTKSTEDLKFFVDSDVTELKFTNCDTASIISATYKDDAHTSINRVELASSNTPISFQIVGDPIKSINPNNTGEVFGTQSSSFFKYIEDLVVADTSVITVTKKAENTWSSDGSSYYVAYDYEINTIGKGSSLVTAKMLPNYQMYADYEAYKTAFATNNQQFSKVQDLASTFVKKYESYIVAKSGENDKVSIGGSQLNGEELIALIKQNGVHTGDIYFTSAQKSYFDACVNFLYVTESMTVAVSTGTVSDIVVNDDIYQVNLFDKNIVFNANTLASTFGLAITPTNQTNDLSSLITNISINSLIVDTTGSDYTYTFENYTNDTKLQNLVALLNNANLENRKTNMSNVLGLSEGENYTAKDFVNTGLTQNCYLYLAESGAGAGRQWALSVYDVPKNGLELYLHFSLTTTRYSTELNEDGEEVEVSYDVVYEAVVQVNVNKTEPTAGDLIKTSANNIPKVFCTNSNVISGISNSFTSDNISTTAVEPYYTLTGFSYNTIRYLVLKSEVLCADGQSTVISIKKNDDGSFIEYTIDENVYYEVADSEDGVLNINAENVSNTKEGTSLKEYVPVNIYVFIIKTDINGDPVYDENGNYQKIDRDKLSTNFIVRSFVEEIYFYRVNALGELVLSNTSINGDRLALYNNRLVILQDTNEVAMYYTNDSQATLDYATVSSAATTVIAIGHNIYPIVDEENYMFALNYVINSAGQFVNCYDQDNEFNCTNALYDSFYQVASFGSSTIDCLLEVEVSTTEGSNDNVDLYFDYSVCTLEGIDINVINITYTCPISGKQNITVNSSPVTTIYSKVEIDPQYITMDESNKIDIVVEGLKDGVADTENTYTLNSGSESVDIYTLAISSNLYWWFAESLTGASNTSIDLLNPQEKVQVTYNAEDSNYTISLGALSFKVSTPEQISTYFTDEQITELFTNYAYNAVVEWTVKLWDETSNSFVEETASGIKANDFASVVVDSDGVAHLVLSSGSQSGQKIRVEVAIYNYETSNTVGTFVYGETNYLQKKVGSFDIVLHRDDPKVKAYAFNSTISGALDGTEPSVAGYEANESGVGYKENTSATPLTIKGSSTINLTSSLSPIVSVSIQDYIMNNQANWEIFDNYSSYISFKALVAGKTLENTPSVSYVESGSNFTSLYLVVASTDQDQDVSFKVSIGNVSVTVSVKIKANVTITNEALTASVNGLQTSLFNESTRTLSLYDSWATVDLTKMFSVADPANSKITFELNSSSSFMLLAEGESITTDSGSVSLYTTLKLGRIYQKISVTMKVLYYTLNEDGVYNTTPLTYSKNIIVELLPTMSLSTSNKSEDDSLKVNAGDSINLFTSTITLNNIVVSNLSNEDFATAKSSATISDVVALTITTNGEGVSLGTTNGVVNTTFSNNVINSAIRVDFVALNYDGESSSSLNVNNNMFVYISVKPELTYNLADKGTESNAYIIDISGEILEDDNINKDHIFPLYTSNTKLFNFSANGEDYTTMSLSAIGIEVLELSQEDGATYTYVDDQTNVLELVITKTGDYISSLSIKKLDSVVETTKYRISLTTAYNDTSYFYIIVEPDIVVNAVYPVGGTSESVLIGQSFNIINDSFANASSRIKLYLGGNALTSAECEKVMSTYTYTFSMCSFDNTLGYIALSSSYATVSSSGDVSVISIPQSVSTIYVKVGLLRNGNDTTENYVYYAISPVSSSKANTTGAINLSTNSYSMVAGVSVSLSSIVGTSTGATFAIVKSDDIILGITKYQKFLLSDSISFVETPSIYNAYIYFYNENRMFSDSEIALTITVSPDVAISNKVTTLPSNLGGVNISDLINVTKASDTTTQVISGMTYSIVKGNNLYAVNEDNATIKGLTYISANASMTIRATYNSGYYKDITFTVYPNVTGLIEGADIVQSGNLYSLSMYAPYGSNITKVLNVANYSNPKMYTSLADTSDINSSIATISYSMAQVDYAEMNSNGNITISPINSTKTLQVVATITYDTGIKYYQTLTIQLLPAIDITSSDTMSTIVTVTEGDTMTITSKIDISNSQNVNVSSFLNDEKNKLSFLSLHLDDKYTSSIYIHFETKVYDDYTVAYNNGSYKIYFHNVSKGTTYTIPVYIDLTGTATSLSDMFSNTNKIYLEINIKTSNIALSVADENKTITLDESKNEFAITDKVTFTDSDNNTISAEQKTNLLRNISYNYTTDVVTADNVLSYDADKSTFIISMGQEATFTITIYVNGESDTDTIVVTWTTEVGSFDTYRIYSSLADAKAGIELSDKYYYYNSALSQMNKANVTYSLGANTDSLFSLNGSVLTYNSSVGSIENEVYALINITDGSLEGHFVVTICNTGVLCLTREETLESTTTIDLSNTVGLGASADYKYTIISDDYDKTSEYYQIESNSKLERKKDYDILPPYTMAVIKVTGSDEMTVAYIRLLLSKK